MVERVEKLIKIDARVVMQSPELYLELLKLYSVLFLMGKQPSDCGVCAYGYFEELKKTGIEKAKFMEAKTCKLNENNIYHVRIGNAIISYSDFNVNDEIAIELLNKNLLKESDFVKLPSDYNKLPDVVIEKKELQQVRKNKKPRY